MAEKKKGLGGGLGSLLGEEAVRSVLRDETEPPAASATGGAAVMLRLVDVCPNPAQPRKTFEDGALEDLADSIRRNGVLQPVLVRPAEGGRYLLIAGERRWRAARLAGLREIPAVISEADEARAAELSLIENLQREDLNPVEEAEGYRALADGYGLTQEEIAERVGKSRPAVANAMRLLVLDKQVLELLSSGALSAGHARALVPLAPQRQLEIALRAVKEGLSVRQTEKLAAQPGEPAGEREEPLHVKVNYNEVLAGELGRSMGRKVRICGGKRKGRVEIEYYGSDDLSRLCELLAGVGGDE